MLAFERSPVFRILGLSAREPFNGDALDALGRVLEGDVAWDQLVVDAKRHRLVVPLLNSLRTGGFHGLVPVDCRHALGQLRGGQVALALQRAGLVVRMAAAFRQAGVDALFLKGPALSQRLYDRPEVRGDGDVDVLIRPEHAERAHLVLAAQAIVPRAGGGTRTHRFVHHEDEYSDTRDDIRVDVHRRLSANPHMLPWDFDALWQARLDVDIGGERVPVLSTGHELLFLMVHGAGHGWQRLRWLTDVAVLSRTPEALAEGMAAAAAVGMVPALHHTLGLAQRWLGMPPTGGGVKQRQRVQVMTWAARAGHNGGGWGAPHRVHRDDPLRYVGVRMARYALRQMAAPNWRCRAYDLLLGVVKFGIRIKLH